MTSLADAEGRSVMRNRLVWLALALSLTLNAFVVAGLVWSQAANPRPANFADRLVEAGATLNLTAEQRTSFNRFAQAIELRTKEMREANGPLFRHIWDELAKADADQAVLNQLVDAASENRHGYQKDVTTDLNAFLGSLSPEQRTQFVDTVRRQMSRERQRH
jgi:Spy/CpxP family protein refolding chaperone